MSDQVTWQELAGVADALDLQPGYSNATGRAFVTLADGSLLWAEVGTVALDLSLPGVTRLQEARVAAVFRKTQADDQARLAALSDAARERELEARRAYAGMPDPPQHQIDAAEERRIR